MQESYLTIVSPFPQLLSCPPLNELRALPTGIEGIHGLIRSLGNRYQGAVVVFNSDQRMAEVISCLRMHSRPVINFNFTNEPCTIDGERTLKKSPYFLLHLDEPAAVKTVLEYLRHFGHRRIGVPWYRAEGFEWVERRMSSIQECVRRYFPELEIVVVEQTQAWWQAGRSEEFRRFLSGAGLLTNDHPTSSTIGDSDNCDSTASLGSLIVHHNITALIALNNNFARFYYCWLKFKGLHIPDDLSLVSFDNTPDALTFPITTIDFGLSRLGYLASHILIGDIPIRADRRGNIPGKCDLVNRGSVGQARSHRFSSIIQKRLLSGTDER